MKMEKYEKYGRKGKNCKKMLDKNVDNMILMS